MRTIARRKVLWQVVIVIAISILWVWGIVRPDDASASTDPCKLLSAGEIESVLGEKVTFPPSAFDAAATGVCVIKIGNGQDNMDGLTVMVVKKPDKPDKLDKKKVEEMVKKGEEMMKKKGIKLTQEKYGNTTCMTSAPPTPPQKITSILDIYSTSCTVDKGGLIVSVGVQRTSEKKMVPISKLRPLAEKAAGRL